jgi:hypothetical protein
MARGRKNPDPNRAKADATWQKTLDAQRKIDAEKVEAIEKWIASNEDLWNQLSDVQRATLADIGNMASETEVLTAKSQEFADIAKDINDEMLTMGVTSTTLLGLTESITESWSRYNDYIEDGSKRALRLAGIMAGVADTHKQMVANIHLIGTEEFQNLNLSRQIAKAKAEGAEEDVDTLRGIQIHQKQLERMNDTIKETGDLLKQPFEAIDTFISDIPIIGKLMSKLFPVGQWGEDFADEFMASAGTSAKDWFIGKMDVGAMVEDEATDGIDNNTVGVGENTISQNQNTQALMVLTDTLSSVEGRTPETPDIAEAQQVEGLETSTEKVGSIDTFAGPIQMTLTGPVQMIVQRISDILATGGEIGAGGNNLLGGGTGIGLPAVEQPLQLTEGTPLALPEPSPTEEEFFKAGLTEGSIFTHLSNVGEVAQKIAEGIKGAFGGGTGGGKEGAGMEGTPDVGGTEDMAENIGKGKEGMKEMDGLGGKLGKKWGTMSTTGKMFAGTVAAVGIGLTGWVVSMFKFTRELGFAMDELPATAVLFKDETSALAEEFGTLRDVNNQLLFDMWKQKMLHGVAVGDMAKILKLQTRITGVTNEMAIEQQSKWMKEFKKEGLAASKVMEDMAQNADFIAMGTKGMGDNMKDAAIFAGKMGTSMSDIDTVATSLLDISASLTAEAELQALTGKSINLDKARLLAYEQNYVGMAEEVKSQLGGQHAWSQMTRIEREAIGELLNLQGSSLANFVTAQVKSNEAAKEGFSTWGMYGAMVLGILGAALAAIPGIGWKQLGMMVLGGAVGTGLGYSIASLAQSKFKAMEAGDVKSEAGGVTQVSTAEGGLWNVSDNDETVIAPNAIATMERGLQGPPVVNVDMKQVTDELKPELQNIVAAVVQRGEEAKEQARKQKRVTEDSGKSR